MKKRLLFVAATVVFMTAAWVNSAAVGQISDPKPTLNIAVVTADPSNDLYRTMAANYDGVRLCKSLDEAVALKNGVKGVMILADAYPNQKTRVTPEQAEAVLAAGLKAKYHPAGRLLIAAGERPRAGKKRPRPVLKGTVAVLTGGTADIPVAEECAGTIEFFGGRAVRYFDVGVAGLHRLLGVIDQVRKADVVVAVAGMEGALPSVVSGLVSAPVVAVPTSVGYGAGAGGVAAALAMLNSCAEGVSVVNIDNGFGAAVVACRMLRRLKA